MPTRYRSFRPIKADRPLLKTSLFSLWSKFEQTLTDNTPNERELSKKAFYSALKGFIDLEVIIANDSLVSEEKGRQLVEDWQQECASVLYEPTTSYDEDDLSEVADLATD